MMHNIEVSGHIIIGGFPKTIGDVREFVRAADDLRLPDEQCCNGAINCRVDAALVQPSTFGVVLHFGRQQPGGD